MGFNAYHILFCSILLLAVFYQLAGRIKLAVGNHGAYLRSFVFAAICIIFILFCGLAGDISSDHSSYVRIFNNISGIEISSFLTPDYQISSVEKGYGLIMWIIAKLGGEPVWIFLVSAALTIIPIAYLAYKTSDPCMFLVLYLGFGNYFDSFNVIRQVIVGGVLVLSMQYIIKSEFWKFLIIDLIFSTIHISALLMIPFYFLLRSKPGIKTTSIQCILILLFSIGFYRILNVFDTTFFDGKYFNSGRIDLGNEVIQVIVPVVLFVLSEILIYSHRMNKIGLMGRFNFEDKNGATVQKYAGTFYNVLWNGSIYWIMFWVFTLRFSYLRRLTYFFLPLILYILTEGMAEIKNKNSRLIVKAFVLVTVIIYYFCFGQYFDSYILFSQ